MRHAVVVVLILFTAACADEKLAKRSYPVIDTRDVSDITEQGVTFNGEILDIGDGIAEYGFVFSHGFLGVYPFPPDATKISLGTADVPGKFSSFANSGMAAGETYAMRTYAVSTKGTVVLGEERKFVSQGSLGPEVKDINPKEATMGDMITITGTRFSAVVNNNVVTIGEGGFASVLKAKTDTLWVRMPSGASVGENTVVVKVGQQSVTAAQKIKLLQITIASFTPESVTLGDTVTITGTNFPIAESSPALRILGLNLAAHKLTRTQLKAVINQDPVSPSTVVELAAGTQSVKTVTQIKLFPPKINAITPATGTSGTEVTITGEYFHPTPSKNTIEMAGKSMTVTAASRTSLKFRVPADILPGVYAISVKTFGQSTVSLSKFEIRLPSVASISPANGTWGTEVTINGENFGPTVSENTVTFSSASGPAIAANILSASETQIKVKVPVQVTSKQSTIRVTVSGSGTRIANFNYFVFDAPLISSFTPTEGKLQTIVTISGNNFHPDIANNVVKFGSYVAEIINVTTTATTTQLSVKVPSMADIATTISVTALGQVGTSLTTFHAISPWRRIKDFPGPGRAFGVAFGLNDQGYVGMGSVANTIKGFWRYTPANDTWAAVKPIAADSHVGYIYGSAFNAGGFGFVAVGTTEPAVFKKYDPTTDVWTGIAPLPVTNTYRLTAFGIGGKGYVTAGTVSADTGVIPCCFGGGRTWEYNPSLNTWTEKAGLPQGRTEATSFTINSIAYVVGGRPHTRSTTILTDNWEFNPGTNQWTAKAQLPTGNWSSPLGFAVDGKGYVLGALINPEARLGSFASFDPVTNQWQTMPPHPIGAREGGVAFVIGNKAYVGWGIDELTRQGVNDFWEFDPSKL